MGVSETPGLQLQTRPAAWGGALVSTALGAVGLGSGDADTEEVMGAGAQGSEEGGGLALKCFLSFPLKARRPPRFVSVFPAPEAPASRGAGPSCQSLRVRLAGALHQAPAAGSWRAPQAICSWYTWGPPNTRLRGYREWGTAQRPPQNNRPVVSPGQSQTRPPEGRPCRPEAALACGAGGGGWQVGGPGEAHARLASC